ncbi:hypothetical protein MPTK1_3g02710 [Marchantia polymorpha subsp. ruderalis]|uniref:Uncharacterized protein n=2 Tax=Marchantia polymorpha TaxID=3197 RepID=A0AAF6AWS7_MARPO|nr:hypothetical protein MARPO_0007s0259 [Marchantia polymorpha]BBN04211.1 hypothetical protein Mp_3g02710 [Marchantia polymorpha subsp. ruderalis]|eukprot:PTQ47897.1 hypothetical protein MARPO_0007s0259 [Marchantia polymorpha]
MSSAAVCCPHSGVRARPCPLRPNVQSDEFIIFRVASTTPRERLLAINHTVGLTECYRVLTFRYKPCTMGMVLICGLPSVTCRSVCLSVYHGLVLFLTE